MYIDKGLFLEMYNYIMERKRFDTDFQSSKLIRKIKESHPKITKEIKPNNNIK